MNHIACNASNSYTQEALFIHSENRRHADAPVLIMIRPTYPVIVNMKMDTMVPTAGRIGYIWKEYD